MFQSVADQFDLREPENLKPGQPITWYATRYLNQMSPGDIVYFWMGGKETERGIYGWGTLTSGPYSESNWDSHGVDARVEVRFSQPLLARDMKRNNALAGLLILRQPQASNFLVEPDQARELASAIRNADEVPPPMES